MRWRTRKQQMTTPEGYLITWGHITKVGPWYNAWAPPDPRTKRRKHLAAGPDLDACKQACEQHLANHPQTRISA